MTGRIGRKRPSRQIHARSKRCLAPASPGMLASLVVALLGGLVPSISADGPMDAPKVRVRLFEQRETIVVTEASGRRVEIESAGSALRVRGESMPVWRSQGGGPLRVGSRSGELRVRGTLQVRRMQEGMVVINEVPLESYVASTLGAEMVASWDPSALEAQAVAIRSYVLHEMEQHAADPWDVTADVNSQVYRGIDSESPSVLRAARNTKGEVLVYAGRPILAAFHSASGGQTASAEEVWGEQVPYLRSQPVGSEEDSPDTYWRAAIRPETLGEAARTLGFEIGDVHEARVRERSQSGRVVEIELRGEKGRAVVGGRKLRGALGSRTLRSTRFEVKNGESGVVFVGSGYGHGVGMSQWAAQSMAREGASYREILQEFYPGAELGSLSELSQVRLPAVSGRGVGPERVEPRARLQ